MSATSKLICQAFRTAEAGALPDDPALAAQLDHLADLATAGDDEASWAVEFTEVDGFRSLVHLRADLDCSECGWVHRNTEPR